MPKGPTRWRWASKSTAAFGDTELVEGVKIIARAPENAVWGRQRQVNALRSSLQEVLLMAGVILLGIAEGVAAAEICRILRK